MCPKVVLAYSGGLDTSVIAKWLQVEKDCEVVIFTADLGQEDEIEPMRKAVQTLQNHRDGIQNWIQSRINNGLLEVLNAIIQAAKRKARGYGKKHFATIAFLLTGKLDFRKVNPFLPTHFA